MVLEILLVEDNPAQAYLVQNALKSWKTPYNLRITSSAEEALGLIRRKSHHSRAPRPHLVLLDLNLPQEPGFTVLEAIKDDPKLRNIVVMVLSSSSAACDVERAVQLHTNAYFTKPFDYDEIQRLFGALETFWRLDVRFTIDDPLRITRDK